MTATEPATTITFEPPGPGTWMLDITHHGRRPLTRFFRAPYEEAFATGMGALIERYGLPLAEIRPASVHGCSYARVIGLGEPEVPKAPPPKPVMWLAARLHPAMRRRARTAAAAWAEKRWRADVDEWFERRRARVVADNLDLQRVDPAALDDEQLLAHLDDTVANFRRAAFGSFELHGGDIIPAGDYFAHCQQWGVDIATAASLLAGASPASLETARLLAPVARAIAAAGTRPSSVDEIRGLGPDANAAVDEWLEQHGWRLLFSDDLDSPTLAESPELQLRALTAAIDPPEPATDPAPVRALVPAAHRAQFDELLSEARSGLRLRDDNVGVAWNWPAGLVRRAVLEAGRRMVDRERLHRDEHVLQLEPHEVTVLVGGSGSPTADDAQARWEFRDAVAAAGPPTILGPEPDSPPFDLLPAPLARAARAVMAMIDAMEGVEASVPLHGVGIGTVPYRGTARVVDDAATAMATIDDGDVVVTSFTGPAWNSLLPVVGALVVEEGGPLCHAAIVAREFGIPAVVGVTGATAQIPDGATVEVDPGAGVVRLL